VLGFSFSEVILIGIVALVAVGPQRLPGMLKNFGMWMRKLRKLTTDVRAQTGIDDLLRAEGIHGGISELRGLMRGHAPAPAAAPYRPYDDPYRSLEVDLSREYPPEGADAKGAMADDLTSEDEEEDDSPVITVTADHTPPEPTDPASTTAEAAPDAASTTAETAPEAAPASAEAAPEPAAAATAEAAPEAAPSTATEAPSGSGSAPASEVAPTTELAGSAPSDAAPAALEAPSPSAPPAAPDTAADTPPGKPGAEAS
jgi:sec-independent protein translocase protein TatB